MSYGPPPGPSEPSGPPAGGGYGPPSGYGSAPSSGTKIDPKSASPLDWAAAGAGVLALIFSFFAFYTYDAKGAAKQACSVSANEVPAVLKPLCSGDSASAWHGFFGWFGVVLLVIAALLALEAVLTAQLTLPIPIRLIGAGLAALGTISVLIALFTVPDWPPVADLITNQSQYDSSVDGGVGFSWYVVLALGLILTVLSIIRFQQTGGALPGRGSATGATSATPGQPGSSGYGAPGGYGGQQPPPQQTPPQQTQPQQPYGQPQGPPPGYQQAPPQGPPQTPPQGPPQGPPPGYQQPPPGYQQGPPPGYTPPSQ